ncbi:MAG: hypothetical protein A2Y21_07025 [Clostridiales bacterium GWC2_40_7]|nr:MAG: hypothetical protein A2Y21_07025 [Clostridiales bacterium GWC2_40_7]
MKNISDLELFKSTIGHEYTGKFLYYAKFTEDLGNRIRKKCGIAENKSIESFFNLYQPLQIAMKPPENAVSPDYSSYYKDIEIPENAYIDEMGVLHLPGSMHHFTEYISPLRNADKFSEIEKYPFADFTNYSDKGMKEAVEAAHLVGRVTYNWVGYVYEESWQIRGYENFLEDMILNPEWCGYIMDKMKERNIINAKAAAKAGVDFLLTGDDVANQRALMFSPDMWRKTMKNRWGEVYEAARAIKPDIQIWYHSDGNIEEIIPDLIEIGVTILNPIQPECMDAARIKKKYGDRIVFDGTIGTQSVMPFGTPEDVRKTVKENLKSLGYDGALILSPTHILEPEVPIENIIAFFEAAGE